MITKNDIGRVVEIEWFDPRSDNRVTFEDFLIKPYFVITTVGKVRHVSKNCVILSHEDCVEDDEEDLSSIHPALISKVTYRG